MSLPEHVEYMQDYYGLSPLKNGDFNIILAYDLGMMVTPYPELCEVKHHVSDQGYGWVTDGGSGSFFLTTI